MVAGAGNRVIEATAVDSIKEYLHLCRPIAEWREFYHAKHPMLATDEWLYRLIPHLNEWIPQNQGILNRVRLEPRLFVHKLALEAWLRDRRQRTLIPSTVASNLGKFIGTRAGCKPTNLFFFCGQTLCF